MSDSAVSSDPAGSPRNPSGRVFAAAVLRHPTMIGAIVPSSQGLGRLLSSGIDNTKPTTVVELGPGTGAVSHMIQRRIAPGSTHIAVELDAGLASYLRREFPPLTVLHGNAADLPALLASANVTHVDAIVCSLPWTLFPAAIQHKILRGICDSLQDTGCFTTFSYRHTVAMQGARRFRKLLDEYFDLVATSKTVWRNVPPAHVYLGRGPRR